MAPRAGGWGRRPGQARRREEGSRPGQSPGAGQASPGAGSAPHRALSYPEDGGQGHHVAEDPEVEGAANEGLARLQVRGQGLGFRAGQGAGFGV